jgi:hypothetical protein
MAASERLKIEAANITTTTNRATLFIRNLGGDNVTLVTAYILRSGTVNPLCTAERIRVFRPGGTDEAHLISRRGA